MSKMIIIEGNSNDKDQTRNFLVKGERGYSAYELYKQHGGTLTEEEWLDAFLNADNYYNKSETNDLLDAKANSSDVYSKTDVDNKLDDITTYSTTEQVVGKWINDKPIYRKVINVSDLTPDADDTKIIAHGISNMSMVVNIKCIANNGENMYFDFNNYTWYETQDVWSSLHTFVDNTNIYVVYQGAQNLSFVSDAYFILEYTKTTDTVPSI